MSTSLLSRGDSFFRVAKQEPKPPKILFCLLSVFLIELVNTACRINQHILPGKERMRSVGDLKLYKGILIAIFPFYGLLGCSSGAAEEAVTIAHILENYEPIFIGVDAFFHNSMIFRAFFLISDQDRPVLSIKNGGQR